MSNLSLIKRSNPRQSKLDEFHAGIDRLYENMYHIRKNAEEHERLMNASSELQGQLLDMFAEYMEMKDTND